MTDSARGRRARRLPIVAAAVLLCGIAWLGWGPGGREEPREDTATAAGEPAREATEAEGETAPTGRSADEELAWTSSPVPVDREAQSLDRLPGKLRVDPFPTVIAFPRNVRPRDGASFAVGERVYRLPGLVARPPDEICRDRAGRRFACGARGRIGLRAAVAGRRLACRVEERTADGVVIDCTLGRETLRERAIREGWAFPRPSAGAGEIAAE